jgi:dienelactone hydrolase
MPLTVSALFSISAGVEIESLPGTKPLTMEGDVASEMVAGIDKFLLRELNASVEQRAKHWNRDFSSAESYIKSVEPNRKRLAHILGMRDARVPSPLPQPPHPPLDNPLNPPLLRGRGKGVGGCLFDGPELVGTTEQPALVGRGDGYEVYAARWPAFGDVHGEGLLLVPTKGKPIANIVAIPDADQTPEQIVGLVEGVPAESQYARRLAESGSRVIVPMLINRGPTINRISNREFLYRSAFELGRHLIGYEAQKVLAAVDWFEHENAETQTAGKQPPCPPLVRGIGVIGWGEGGMLALYAGAIDTRIDAVCVSGYFESRQEIWQGPIYRNVFGLLEQFGDAELASMIAPRTLIVEAAKGPEVVVPPGTGGAAPSTLTTPRLDSVRKELERARELVKGLEPQPRLELVVSGDGTGSYGSAEALQALLNAVSPGVTIAVSSEAPQHLRRKFDPDIRHARQMHEIDRHNQWLLRESPYVRAQFFSKLDISSLEKSKRSEVARNEAIKQTIEWYREFFYDEVIGRFDYNPPPTPSRGGENLLPFNVRTRKSYDEPEWTGYEVVMDVFPDVIAYGILLLPKDLKAGEKRPVVVCQHGLEGRPQDVVKGDNDAYHDFAARLAERGFITFAPQNLYIFTDRFRILQRKANPIKKTLFSIIVPQHQQITEWLKSLPYVDAEHIAFYGLSYGGKTAMRVPPLVKNYCLSICSADYNEWVWKNAASWGNYTYVRTGEYEIFEFDLGSTFNYAEMSWLICPRPFMVERGHFDGVAPDEWVAYEYAKTKRHYDLLGIGNRTEMEVFIGPHTIHGVGTFEFLHRHLNWPKP